MRGGWLIVHTVDVGAGDPDDVIAREFVKLSQGAYASKGKPKLHNTCEYKIERASNSKWHIIYNAKEAPDLSKVEEGK